MKIEDIDQNTVFTVDRSSGEYSIQTSSPENSTEFFSNTEDRKVILKAVCTNLQQIMEAESNTEALGLETVNVYDEDGNILDNNTTMEKDEIATTLNNFCIVCRGDVL